MTAAAVVKAALVDMLRTAYAGETVAVSYGHPGRPLEADVVAAMGVYAEQGGATMRTGGGSREEELRLTVEISCFVGGGPEAQQPATERAYALLGTLEAALRADQSLGGTVREAEVLAHEMAEATQAEVLSRGRVTDVSVVIRAAVRI